MRDWLLLSFMEACAIDLLRNKCKIYTSLGKCVGEGLFFFADTPLVNLINAQHSQT